MPQRCVAGGMELDSAERPADAVDVSGQDHAQYQRADAAPIEPQKARQGSDGLSRELGDALPSDTNVENALESAVINELLADFIKRQSKLNRGILICRYYYLDSIAEIAGRFNMTQNQVKLRLYRLRKKLRDYLEKEGIA